MDNKLYLIHEDDYLRHIDQKLTMYDLVLELVDTLRKDLAEGKTARAVRNLCSYEQDAHILFECWTIPDAYAESCGDPVYLSRLMERELTPVNDDNDDEDESDPESGDLDEDGADNDSGVLSVPFRLLRVAKRLNRSADDVLNAITTIMAFEAEIDRILSEEEKLENDCAE